MREKLKQVFDIFSDFNPNMASNRKYPGYKTFWCFENRVEGDYIWPLPFIGRKAMFL